MARQVLAQRLGLAETSVNAYVSALRRELADFGLRDTLETVRGAGYRISIQDAQRVEARLGLPPPVEWARNGPP